MRHLLLQFAAATALTAASLATASAHATLETAEAAPGAYKAVIRIGHGCDGQPLAGVTGGQVASGQDAHALDHPAPGLVVLASNDGKAHGHGAAAAADDAVTAGDLEIGAAWARAMLAGQKAAGGYLTISNKGAEADRLVGAASPLAGKVEVHTMEVVKDVMTMRPVEGGLEIPAGGTVELKPGGYHIMFMDVKTPFAEGGTVPVTLEFEKAGAVAVSLPVRVVKGAGGHGDMGGHGKGGHGKGHD